MEMEVIVERCAFLDVHRDTVMACARTPDGHGGRCEDVVEFGTTTSQLLLLADWLTERRVTLVGMEATGVYWKPVVRHEALMIRGEMKGLPLWAVAAAC
ncbi:MAG: hypothetical protein JJE52_13705 [Acidimicrobiia bacterium]|nr:hypothetical protein [Acidimicrobiia bacterium]